jgi:eukaryotic-like serine/threonine-protein kinase
VHSPTGSGLVGRERELGQLLPVVDAALGGRGALVLVGGEPGIGKSRLAEVLAGHAAGRGAAVLVGRCWEAGGAPPYWPWVQALDAYARAADPSQPAPEAPALAAILPSLAQRAPSEQGVGSRFRLFAAVAAFLRRASHAQPVALFLDDLHAADPPSLELLRFMVAELPRTPMLLVGCFRDTVINEALREVIADVSRERDVHRITLHGLRDADVARLLELAAGTHLEPALVARVRARSEGNPLFAVETARLLAGEHPAADPLPIPQAVTDVINQRVRTRSAACRDVLLRASVIGREFSVELLERATALDEDALLAALEEAEPPTSGSATHRGPRRVRGARDGVLERSLRQASRGRPGQDRVRPSTPHRAVVGPARAHLEDACVAAAHVRAFSLREGAVAIACVRGLIPARSCGNVCRTGTRGHDRPSGSRVRNVADA